MEYQFAEALPILQRTPAVLRALLAGLPDAWIQAHEGDGTWNPYDVVGHMTHGERSDWIPRVEHLLQHGDAVPFKPFDREAMFEESKGKSLQALLDEFETERRTSLQRLAELNLSDADLARTGRHPHFGVVTLSQLLSTWVVHDLTHLSQIVRVMAHQYAVAVGPWEAYLSILKKK